MKKLLIAATTILFATGTAYAAGGMDCCKDGCTCCDKMKKEGEEHPMPSPAPAPTPQPQP